MAEEEKKPITEEQWQEFEKLRTELIEFQKQRDEYLNGWQRAKADFINYKKDEEERFRAFAAISLKMLLLEMIEVLNSFDLGLAAVSDEAVKKGMNLIKMKFEDSLKKFGLAAIIVQKGDVFNPEKHEVVGEVETNDLADGVVFEELEKGYLLNDRVIRAAKVRVAKAPPNIS
ncbi:MAG: nucleotide exchange factor GrpE [bacterium]|nr:nucleotide exchange factor GrpE [bacterium]